MQVDVPHELAPIEILPHHALRCEDGRVRLLRVRAMVRARVGVRVGVRAGVRVGVRARASVDGRERLSVGAKVDSVEVDAQGVGTIVAWVKVGRDEGLGLALGLALGSGVRAQVYG